MKKQRYSLIEVGNELKMPIGDLIDFGAQGELLIHAIADEWKGRDAKGMDVTIDGVAVDLDPKDLIKAVDSDQVTVRRVRTSGGDTITLNPPQIIMRGVLQVAADERERLRAAYRSAQADEAGAIDRASPQGSPPYLDPNDDHYSEKLAAAVGAWTALYVDGGFQKGVADKKQIMNWLRDHHPALSNTAQEQIATIVNPNEKGGNPKTRKG